MSSHDKALRPSDDESDPPAASRNGSAQTTEDLARRVAASLAPGDLNAIAEPFAAWVRDPAQYEASVRSGPSGLTAGRMMIERSSVEVLQAIAAALHVVLPPAALRWLGLARQTGLPLITGWDLRNGDKRCVKLYVNASDASRATRSRLCAALLPSVNDEIEPAAVLGMNAGADGVTETKFYVQSADAVALASKLGGHAQALAESARSEAADAGAVLSFDVNDHSLRPRAFFVALREPSDQLGWRCVRSLPGYDARAIESLLPFAPAPPRSLGIALGGEAWTLYCKPRGSGRAPEALEPVAIFRTSEAEVGVFVEPTEHAARAFRRTERHAISVRVRDGAPAPLALESLVDWFTSCLRAAELADMPSMPRLVDPPAPWCIVVATESASRREES